MNQSIQTFLTFNAVLNGYRLGDSFEGGIAQAAELLKMPLNSAEQLEADIAGLYQLEVMDTLNNSVLRALINFFRNDEYAFIAPTNIAPISIRAVAEFDKAGQLNDETRLALLKQFIRYIYPTDNIENTCIADGVLYVPESEMNALDTYILNAYIAVTKGPDPANAKLVKRMNSLTVSSYAEITPTALKGHLQDFVRRTCPPTLWRDMVLMIPDYMTTYTNLGVLAECSTTKSDSMALLLPVRGSNSAKSVHLGYSTVAGLLGENIRALNQLEYTTEPTEGTGELKGLVFKYEKV